MRRLLLANHHTPYTSLLARALPEWGLQVVPTSHAPEGWRLDQRPKPLNVGFADSVSFRYTPPDVLLLQSPGDLVRFQNCGLDDVPLLYLSHNRVEYEWQPQLNPQLWRMPLVCISDMKAKTWREAGYPNEITVIPPGIPTEDYGGWTGNEPRILTVANYLRRPLFDTGAWLAATEGLPVTLVGEGNEGLPGAVGSSPGWDELRALYRSHRAYLCVNKYPNEDPWNLAMLEAAATGMPLLLLHGYPHGHRTPQQLREEYQRLLEEPPGFDYGWRRYVQREFPFEDFSQAWSLVLEETIRNATTLPGSTTADTPGDNSGADERAQQSG